MGTKTGNVRKTTGTVLPETFRFMACEFTFTIRVRVTNSDKVCKKPTKKVRIKVVLCKRIDSHFLKVVGPAVS